MTYALWNLCKDLRSDAYEWVELSHSLNNDSPFWSGIPAGSVELSKTCFDWGNPMLECLIQTFRFPGQFGTHIDFPGHFVKDAPLSESFGTDHMMLLLFTAKRLLTGNPFYYLACHITIKLSV